MFTTISISYKIILSICFILLTTIIRNIIVYLITHHKKRELSRRRKLIVISRNIGLLILIVGLTILWFTEIRTAITAFVVIAVAIVIATKELLINLLGSLYRSSSQSISVGDRIEIDGVRGDVIDQTLSGITLLEIGSGTNQFSGRNIFIPNSKFLSHKVFNETKLKHYVFHVITIPLGENEDWQKMEAVLLEIANEIVNPYHKELEKHMKRLSDKYSLDIPSVEPRVHLQLKEADKTFLALRIPVPIQRRGRLEQHILREYLLRKKVL